MMANCNLHHPRNYVDGEAKLIPICTPVGSLTRPKLKQSKTNSFSLSNYNSKSSMDSSIMPANQYNFDTLGIGVSIYFKLLKSLAILMFFFAILFIPVCFVYSRGGVAD